MSQIHSSQPTVEMFSGRLMLEVDPGHGGVIRRFTLQHDNRRTDLLRPSPEDSNDPLDSGCFPLVPFSNRIGRGEFNWGGRTVHLPCNMAGENNAIHGHGWQRAWQVTRHDGASLELAYDHAPDDWPFAYRAEQHFALAATGITVTLSLTNTGPLTMPAGLGFHPYFCRSAGKGLRANVSGVWLNGPDMLPTDHVSTRIPQDMLAGWLPPGAQSLDHCFTGWSRTASIDLPGTEQYLTLTGSDDLRFLVVFAPDNEDFFCAEPVSNINNAVNRRDDADTGLTALAAGATMKVVMTLGLSD